MEDMKDMEVEDIHHLVLLPTEVYEDFLLKHLKWNDFLNLRLVCGGLYGKTQDFLKKGGAKMAPEIEISEKAKNNVKCLDLAAFLRMGIASKKIFLNNLSGKLFYEDGKGDWGKFLKRFGKVITHLRVHQLTMYSSGEEKRFLEAKELVALESFTAQLVYVNGTPNDESNLGRPIVPARFRNLRSLNVEELTGYNKPDLVYSLNETWSICESLKHLTFPLVRDVDQCYIDRMTNGLLDCLTRMIQKWNGDNGGSLKTIDFHKANAVISVKANETFSVSFLQLCKICLDHNVKLQNIHLDWFPKLANASQLGMPLKEVGVVVSSLVCSNRLAHLKTMNLSEVESIEITCCQHKIHCFYLGTLGVLLGNNRTLYTPKLRSFSLTLTGHMNATNHGFQYFFSGLRNCNLRSLRVAFTSSSATFSAMEQIVTEIVTNCPGVTSLTLEKWELSIHVQHRLWRGLTNLEELTLDECYLNAAFGIGENNGNPTMLQLSGAKKLTLKNVVVVRNGYARWGYKLVGNHVYLAHQQ